MEAQIVYIKLLRLSLKSASNVSKIRLQELAAGIGELRQLLSCVVCRELLKDPYEPARRRCGHHVCRLCLRGRKRLKPSCEQCQDCFDFKTYKENKSMAWQVLCYQTLCKQLQNSLLYAQLAGQRPLNCRQYNELGMTMSRIQLPDETAQWFIREGANYNDMCDTFLPQPDRLTLKDIASLPAETPPTTAATTPELPYEQHLPEQQLSLTDIELEAAATGDQYMHHPLPLLASSSSAARMLQIPTATTQTIMTAGYMEPSWTDQVDLSAAFTLNTFGHSGSTANYATYVLPSGCTELPLHMPAIGQVVEVPLEAMTASTSTAVVPEAVPATVSFKRRHAELLAEELQQQQLEQQQEKISRLPQKPTIISSVQVKPPTALAPLAAVPKTITSTVPKTMTVTVPKTMTSTVPKAMHAAVTTVVPKTPIGTSKLLTATPATTKALSATVAAAIPKDTTSSLAVTVPKATTSLTATVPRATTSSLAATAPKTLTTPIVVKVSKASTSLTATVPKTLTTSVAAKAVKVSTSSTPTAPKISTSQTATIPKKLPTSVAAIATKTLATASPSKGTTLTRSAVNAKTTTTAQAATMSKSTVSAKAQATVQAAAVVTTRSTATSRAAAAPVAPTTAKVAAAAAPPKVIEKSPKELRASQKLKPKEKRGCRCGTSSAPGKATCRTTRCACYVVGLKCVDCKCNGCKNPHTYVGDSSDEDDADSELEAEMEAELAAEEAEVVAEEPVEASPPPPAPMPSGVTLVLVSNPQASQRPMVVMQNESGEYQYFNAFNGSVPIDPVEAGFPCVVMPPPPAPPAVEQTAKKFKVSPPQTEMSSHSRLESVDELLGASSKSKVVVGDCPQALFEDIMSGSDDL